jgi:hypothetical protein
LCFHVLKRYIIFYLSNNDIETSPSAKPCFPHILAGVIWKTTPQWTSCSSVFWKLVPWQRAAYAPGPLLCLLIRTLMKTLSVRSLNSWIRLPSPLVDGLTDFFFGSAGDGIQGLAHARQVFYHWAISPDRPFL